MIVTRNQLEAQLQTYYTSTLTVAEITDLVLALDPRWRRYVLDWIVSVTKTDPELAHQFARQAKSALHSLGREGSELWLQTALDVYFEQGLAPALQALKNLDLFIAAQRKRSRGLELSEVRNVLQIFLHGLNGRQLAVEAGDEIFTDSETLFLPAVMDQFGDATDNFAALRACAIHQWAQCWYGTWQADTIAMIPREEPILSTFHYLETLRLMACLGRDYPGLARQLQALQPPTAKTWQALEAELDDPNCSVLDSIRLSTDHWDKPRPDRFVYQGRLDPDRVQAVLETRLPREKQQLKLALARLAAEQPMPKSLGDDSEIERLKLSIMQDLGEIPADYLEPAPRLDDGKSPVPDSTDVVAADSGDDTYLYDEWDYTRRAHRKRWCALRERVIEPDYASEFVSETLHKYQGHLKSLRRSFEALRDEYKILKKQPDGESLDLDALVEAIADARSGMEMTSRIYRKARRVNRNIAVIFMVDMSGSMKGWINQVEREALLLLAEALQSLDDRYAIYGFSGSTRKRCELYRIKTFDEAYDLDVRARIAAIEPQEFTRMGVTIRHLSQLLDRVNAKTKLLITLSDGRPYDYDSYDDAYAIEDTRMALYEARQRGIHPFCITIDEQARDYLPYMFGASSYALIDQVGKLPYRISEIYRGLTS